MRRPLEAESAALGAALQAAALVSNVPSTREYVLNHPPPFADDVEVPDPTAGVLHAANYEKFVSEGEALFDNNNRGG